MSYSNKEFIMHLKLGTGVAASAFIDNAEVDGNTGIYSYFDSFEEFLLHNPNSNIRKDRFTQYFRTVEDIEILLFREPVRLLKNIPILHRIKISISFNDKIYNVDVNNNDIENIYQLDLHEMAMNNNKWIRFVDKFVFDSKKRSKFINRFVTVLYK